MKQRIYIETTIPSFYYTLRTDEESRTVMNWTRRWWSEIAPNFTLVTGPPVIAELRKGACAAATEQRLSLLNDAELLNTTDHIDEVVNIYMKKLLMPNDPSGDAVHLALASVHRVEALLTWNCRHLANPNKMEHIRRVNHELGLPTPLLMTPLNYLS
uniref:Predicted nucleic acid-binding protein, contains PIN domain n=1 Tax=Candidatus Kentrum sp. MB TaxID=2138164 RepID=A0A450XTQ4_9GAMM|nr:MAG: Predicted nucleic acid-binding protein, contains PIN domain [Candidatus Kentron sp. MB]VFK35353.1 MAG: Predicted nucleic acid-binding protein, contains PIN domain [Candidatus Kentron sp. MB]VFK77240.1 MAG: Predicted nucleic acid-binding protein, contains PIN domain [Candidatus Kentron sp. MB]